MEDRSQQEQDSSRRNEPAPRDLRAALAVLPEEELLRLRAIARLRARALPGGTSWLPRLPASAWPARWLARLPRR
jgi:hypothetical protein